MLETANDLIANKKNSAREPIQVLALLQHVLTPSSVSVGTRIAEIVYRHGRGHPTVLEPFLTRRLPFAHRPVAAAEEVNQ